jgi:hypothetical protein
MTIRTHPDSNQLSSGFQSSRLSLLGSRDMDPIGGEGIDPDCGDAGREPRRPERGGYRSGTRFEAKGSTFERRTFARASVLTHRPCTKSSSSCSTSSTHPPSAVGGGEGGGEPGFRGSQTGKSVRMCLVAGGAMPAKESVVARIDNSLRTSFEQRRPEPTIETNNVSNAARVALARPSNSHRAISHRSQVRESTSRGESRSNAAEREEVRT